LSSESRRARGRTFSEFLFFRSGPTGRKSQPVGIVLAQPGDNTLGYIMCARPSGELGGSHGESVPIPDDLGASQAICE